MQINYVTLLPSAPALKKTVAVTSSASPTFSTTL